jgi:hypothetical protein
LVDGDAISDAAANTLAGTHTIAVIFTGQPVYTIDKAPPVVNSIFPADANPSVAATVHFTITFSKSVTGVDAADFALVQAGGVSGATIAGVSGSGTIWSVTSNTGTGNGTLGLNLVNGDSISDTAGNILAGAHTGATLFTGQPVYTIAKPLTVQSVSPVGLEINVPQGTAVVNVVVATFTSSGGSPTASDFTATIDWGDGTSSPGTIAALASGFTVTASHNYPSPGQRPVKITVSANVGAATGQVSTTATVGSSTERFVAQVYRDLLHREVEPLGLEIWSGLIDGGQSRSVMVHELEKSLEYRDDVVQGLFRLFLHRSAEAAILAVDGQFLATGGTPEQIAEVLVSSPEYFQARAGGNNAGFLHAFYNDALGRDVDAASLQAAGNMDFSNANNRVLVAATVFSSDEYLHDLVNFPGANNNPFHDELPNGFYQAFLHRNAEAAGLAHFVGLLKAGTPDGDVVAEIIASSEYLARSSQQPG